MLGQAHGRYEYVVNGVSADIFGFKTGGDGKLEPLEGSFMELSAEDATPAQIAFSPGGDALLVYLIPWVKEETGDKPADIIVSSDNLILPRSWFHIKNCDC